MKKRYEVAIVGSGFAGSLLARVLARLDYDVVLLERGTHPRFAIGESSTPLANLSLERLAARYGFDDCYALATHGRWLAKYPHLRRGLKRGFTFYRHHPGQHFRNRGHDSERLLVAASPHDEIADSHWFRADVDHAFVREALAAGVDYEDEVVMSRADFSPDSVGLTGKQRGQPFELEAGFIIDASGPGGFLARQLQIPSGLVRTGTRSALVYSHFENVRLMSDVAPGLPQGPYPDDWAAVHHIIDEGWMYSLRFDHGTTSAGFLITPRSNPELIAEGNRDPVSLWRMLLDRYPTIGELFADASTTMPIAFRPLIQHRLTRATGQRWVLMPHAYGFVDPLFSTGIAWSLRAVERLGLMFEEAAKDGRIPNSSSLERYSSLLCAEADQIDLLVAGAYQAMAHFDLFAAQAMLYFASVSYAEASQRLNPDDDVAWRGFLGVGDKTLEPLAREALGRLNAIAPPSGKVAKNESSEFAHWVASSIKARNVAGLGNPTRKNLYPVDFDALLDAHDLLGLTHDELVAALPALRGSPTSQATFGGTLDKPAVSPAPTGFLA